MSGRDGGARPARTEAVPARVLYRTLWRWHFYAGLFCVPFVLWLSVTGSIYLFHPQIDAWLERPYDQVSPRAPRLPPSAQVAAALAAYPGDVLNAYQLPGGPRDAAQVLIGKGATLRRVYVDPVTASVLHSVREDHRFTRRIFHLHGELLMGSVGSMLVELAAGWTLVMLLSGLYLWWPRGRRLAGVLYPRLAAKGRLFWRDMHAVTGVWVSLLAMFLILSGLPWARFWGGELKQLRALVAPHAAAQDWTTGRASELVRRRLANTPAGSAPDLTALNRMLPVVKALHLAPPVLIAPANRRTPYWSARSEAPDRPLRVDLRLDPASGRVVERTDFDRRPLIDRLVGYGVALHEGQYFGIANQLLGLGTALGLVVLSISAVVLWWRRRPAGVLGAPPGQPRARVPRAVRVTVVCLGLYLPLLGVSMLGLWLLERVLLSRIGPVRAFLGLTSS